MVLDVFREYMTPLGNWADYESEEEQANHEEQLRAERKAKKQKVKELRKQVRLLQREQERQKTPKKHTDACDIIVAHPEVDMVVGHDRNLVIRTNPYKNTVKDLYTDIRAIMKTNQFTLKLNQKRIDKPRKKLYQCGAFAGGTFVLDIVTTQH